jgi:peptidoglycan hydrolase-like protein with peptidoglycan-binding domain
MKTWRVLGALVVAAAVAGTLGVAATVAEAQDLTKMKGKDSDPCLNMMLNYCRDDVREAQEALKTQGYDPGTTDGIMWPWTHKALEAFQRDHRLAVTGELDAATLAAIREDVPAAASPPSR